LRVGQEVASREKIGTVGLYPVLQGPGLYFELRFKQKAINPEQWFAS
jgi:septal ring factor EnvC (AmiA/AmiB activator)